MQPERPLTGTLLEFHSFLVSEPYLCWSCPGALCQYPYKMIKLITGLVSVFNEVAPEDTWILLTVEKYTDLRLPFCHCYIHKLNFFNFNPLPQNKLVVVLACEFSFTCTKSSCNNSAAASNTVRLLVFNLVSMTEKGHWQRPFFCPGKCPWLISFSAWCTVEWSALLFWPEWISCKTSVCCSLCWCKCLCAQTQKRLCPKEKREAGKFSCVSGQFNPRAELVTNIPFPIWAYFMNATDYLKL